MVLKPALPLCQPLARRVGVGLSGSSSRLRLLFFLLQQLRLPFGRPILGLPVWNAAACALWLCAVLTCPAFVRLAPLTPCPSFDCTDCIHALLCLLKLTLTDCLGRGVFVCVAQPTVVLAAAHVGAEFDLD